jgi:hypothetical protein
VFVAAALLVPFAMYLLALIGLAAGIH